MSAPPLRVVFCHYTADVCGGSDKSLFLLVTHLPEDRVTPVMLLKDGDPMAEAYRAAGVEVHTTAIVPPRRALEPGKLLRFFAAYLPTVLRMRRIIRRSRADVAHVNTLFNLQAPLAARLAGRPLVWHVREMLPGSRVYGLLCRLAARLATRVIAISSAVAADQWRCGGRLRRVLNGTDLGAFETPADGAPVRADLGIASDRPVVTVLGRLEPWKGQHVLVEAIPAVLEAVPEAVFLFVGGPAVNKPDYGPGLEARCRELGVADHVRFTGIRRDVPAVLAATDILALPTVTPEPFGLTVIEAMAAGRPVVATAAGGPLDTVLDGKTGLLVRPDDPADLAEKLARLLGDPDRARAMGHRARERAFAEFSVDRVAREVTEVLEEAAGRRPPPSAS